LSTRAPHPPRPSASPSPHRSQNQTGTEPKHHRELATILPERRVASARRPHLRLVGALRSAAHPLGRADDASPGRVIDELMGVCARGSQSQIGRSRHPRRKEAAQVEAAEALSVMVRSGPLETAVNGTLVARPGMS
jgi:hypothetical protein